MEQLINELLAENYHYTGYLCKGLFGDQIAAVINPDNQLWFGITLVISFIAAIFLGLAVLDNPKIGMRVFSAVGAVLIILGGTHGPLIIALAVALTVIIAMGIISFFIEDEG